MQIDCAESDMKLRDVFDDDEGNGDNGLLLLETGYRKPLSSLGCEDKPCIKKAIRDYHTLVKIKPELDQFSDGLETLNVLPMMKKYPSLMSSLFVDKGRDYLNKGIINIQLKQGWLYGTVTSGIGYKQTGLKQLSKFSDTFELSYYFVCNCTNIILQLIFSPCLMPDFQITPKQKSRKRLHMSTSWILLKNVKV